MFGLDREVIAYSLIGVLALASLIFLVISTKRRRREKLRRRGVKRYGH